MNLADWLNDFCMLMDYFWFDGQSALYLWNTGELLQLYLAGFLRKNLFGQKRQSMLKSDHKIGFFLHFEKFRYWFLLETYLNKNWCFYLIYCTKLMSRKILVLITRKAFNQLDCRILWSRISLDGMTGSHLFLHTGCGSQRLLKGCIVTENNIE